MILFRRTPRGTCTVHACMYTESNIIHASLPSRPPFLFAHANISSPHDVGYCIEYRRYLRVFRVDDVSRDETRQTFVCWRWPMDRAPRS
jgi:hypothetical protein